MIPLSRDQVAELRGCTPATVSRANLPHSKNYNENVYDLLNPQIWEYVTEKTVQLRIRELQSKTVLESEDEEMLKNIKMQEQIEKIRKENRKLDLQHEITARNLVPAEQIDFFIGAFAEGINNNFLTIPTRIGKGNPGLHDKLAAEIKKAIEKTLDLAAKGLEKHTADVIRSLQEDE